MTRTRAMLSRKDKVALISILRKGGYTSREIGEQLGLSASGVRNLINDPTGEKQRERRKRYQGTCEKCGAATDGSNGRGSAPKRCARCQAIRNHEERRWTPETVLASVAALNDLCVEVLGRPIRASDWTALYDSQVLRYSETRLRETDRLWAAARERGLTFVHHSIIVREVGGLDAAKQQLGIEDAAVRRGGWPTRRRRVA